MSAAWTDGNMWSPSHQRRPTLSTPTSLHAVTASSPTNCLHAQPLVKRDPGRSRQFAALRGIQLELTEIGAHRAFCTSVILSTIHLSTCWTSSTHSTTATGWFSKTFVPQNY